MRRIFRDTTAMAVAFSLVLPTVGSAQRAAPTWQDADAAGPDGLVLAQAGAPVVVIPADAAKADPRARQQAEGKAAAGKQDADGKQDRAAKAAPEDPAKAALAEAARAAKGDEPARAQPAKAASDKGKAPKADAGKDAAGAVKADGAREAEAKAAKAARQDAEAQRNARAANEKAAKAKAAAEARDQAAERQAAERQAAERQAAERKAAAARKAAAEADAKAKAKARQDAAKAEDASAARAAAQGTHAPAPVVVTPANPAPRKDAQDAAKADDKAPARAVAQGTRAPAPVVVTPADPTPRKDAQDAAKADDKAPARAAAEDTRAPAPVVVTPAARGEAGNAASSPAGQTPEDIARALAAREGAGVVVTPAAPAADRSPANPRDQAGANPAERAALAEARRAAGTVPETRPRETDAAREAAAMGAVPAAAAAALSGGAAPVVVSDKTAVTRENSRDATEDFATDLNGRAREALSDAAAAAARDKGRVVTGGQPPLGGSTPVVVGGRDGNDRDRREAKDNKDSDLEHALKGVVLPALAGMVVGKVLSNNRSVALNTGDRVVVTRGDGSQELIKDDNALLMRPGSTVQSEQFADGSSRTIVTREDGSQVVTIRDADLRVLRRSVVHADGRVTPLIDETAAVRPVDVASLPAPARPVAVTPDQPVSDEALRAALRRETSVGRTFTLGQIRNIPEVRALVAPIDIQSITFDTGSAAIRPDQAQSLASLGRVLAESVRDNPSEMFLIEGHTDTVGGEAANLALSDRRAESVALALTEFFQVPPENMVVQGYGEAFPKIEAQGDIRANRRATVRRITDLLARN